MTTSWRSALIEDIAENDSDKSFTVPTNTEWELLWIRVQYTSSGSAGFRQLEVQIQNSGSVIAQWQPGTSQAENLTYNYLFAIGVPDLLSPRDTNYLMTPLIGTAYLGENQSIRIWDNNSIDPTGDNMILQIKYGYCTIV